MQNKKILIATWTFYPAWGYWGIARVMFDLSKQLVNDGYDVDVITTDVFDNNSRHDRNRDYVDWMNIYYFKNLSNKLANIWKMPLPIHLCKWLKINIQKYNIVHIWDFRNIFNFIIYIYCKKYSIPYVLSPFWSVPFRSDLRWIIKKIFDITWSKKFLKQAKYVTVQTQSEYNEIFKYSGKQDNIKLIPLMIDYEKFRNTSERWVIRKKYVISDDAKVLLFVGRLHEYKATDMMIECFYEYQKKVHDSYLIIVGRDDGYESKLKDLTRKLWLWKKVIFTGPVYYPENINYYVDADIYFMTPSHWEETSTASLESLACWTPCIVTEQADIPFIHNYNAGTVAYYDQNAIMKALLNMTKKDELSCKQLIIDHFDVKSIKNEFLKLYF